MVTTSLWYRYRQFPTKTPNLDAKADPKSQSSCSASSTGNKTHSFTSLPLGELPAPNIASDSQPMAVNLPEGVERPGCSGRFSMRRASAPLLCIFWGSPDAGCKVATLLIWRAEPVPELVMSACCLLQMNIMAGCQGTYFKNPPLAVASAWAALSNSPRSA